MKVKTCISISEELLENIDKIFDKQKNRSELIEQALWDFIERQKQKKINLKDLDILNKKAAELNREAEDVLSYQVEL